MSTGVSEAFDQLVTRVAKQYCTPADYSDRNMQVEDVSNVFYQEQAARDFVALLDRFGPKTTRALLIIEATRNPLSNEVLVVLKMIDSLTTGWLDYLAIHGHIPVDAQMFAATVLAYDITTVIANGAN